MSELLVVALAEDIPAQELVADHQVVAADQIIQLVADHKVKEIMAVLVRPLLTEVGAEAVEQGVTAQMHLGRMLGIPARLQAALVQAEHLVALGATGSLTLYQEKPNGMEQVVAVAANDTISSALADQVALAVTEDILHYTDSRKAVLMGQALAVVVEVPAAQV
jgi:hypothetical protein